MRRVVLWAVSVKCFGTISTPSGSALLPEARELDQRQQRQTRGHVTRLCFGKASVATHESNEITITAMNTECIASNRAEVSAGLGA